MRYFKRTENKPKYKKNINTQSQYLHRAISWAASDVLVLWFKRDNLKLKSEISINVFYRQKNHLWPKVLSQQNMSGKVFFPKKRNWKIYRRQKMSSIFLHFKSGLLLSDSITLRWCCCCCCSCCCWCWCICVALATVTAVVVKKSEWLNDAKWQKALVYGPMSFLPWLRDLKLDENVFLCFKKLFHFETKSRIWELEKI